MVRQSFDKVLSLQYRLSTTGSISHFSRRPWIPMFCQIRRGQPERLISTNAFIRAGSVSVALGNELHCPAHWTPPVTNICWYAQRKFSTLTLRKREATSQGQSRLPPVLGGGSRNRSSPLQRPEPQEPQVNSQTPYPPRIVHKSNSSITGQGTNSQSPVPIVLFRDSSLNLAEPLYKPIDVIPRFFDQLYNVYNSESSAATRRRLDEDKLRTLHQRWLPVLRELPKQLWQLEPQAWRKIPHHVSLAFSYLYYRYYRNVIFYCCCIVGFWYTWTHLIFDEDDAFKVFGRRRGEIVDITTSSVDEIKAGGPIVAQDARDILSVEIKDNAQKDSAVVQDVREILGIGKGS